MRKTPYLVIAAVVVIAAGCASAWKPAPPVLSAPHWALDTPDGWMHLTMPTYDMLSRDGPYLQYVFIQEQPYAKGLRHTQRKIDGRMLPDEAAAATIASLTSDPVIRNFRLIRNTPVTLGGKMGFRLVYEYVDGNGVAMRCDHLGVTLPETFFSIRYTAAQRHYFDTGAGVFQGILNSLRFSDH